MCIPGIFTTIVYVRPHILRAHSETCQTCITGCFLQNPVKHRYIQNSRHIHNLVKYLWWRILFTNLCVTLAYLEQWHIQTPKHNQNTGKHVSLNILLKTLCNPEMFRTLVYSELWYILKSANLCCQEKLYSEPYRISKMRHFIKNPV